MRERGGGVVELAEHVRGLLGQGDVGACHQPGPRHAAAHVPDRVAGDEDAGVGMAQRHVARCVARCVHHLDATRDGQDVPVADRLGDDHLREPAGASVDGREPARRVAGVARRWLTGTDECGVVLVHGHARRARGAHDVLRSTGVVDVRMREHDARHVPGVAPHGCQPGPDATRCGPSHPAVDEGDRAVVLDEREGVDEVGRSRGDAPHRSRQLHRRRAAHRLLPWSVPVRSASVPPAGLVPDRRGPVGAGSWSRR